MSKKQILKDLSDGKITADEAEEQIDKLQKEVTLKVTQKGVLEFMEYVVCQFLSILTSLTK